MRQITDAILMANEIVDGIFRNNSQGVICKLDMEKAFDSMSWNFIEYVLGRLGFSHKWRGWISTCISSTSFATSVNGGPSAFFNTSRDLKQGDPLSPLLFIIVMETLNKMIDKVRELNMMKDITVGNGDKQIEISHPFFADDTLFFCQPDISTLLNLRCIMLCFQAVSGLNINLDKSELVEFGCDCPAPLLTKVLGCKTANFPIKYLGILFGAKHKDSSCWEAIINIFQCKLANWKSKFISKGGILTLIKSTLSNLLIHYLSVLTIPAEVAKKLESIQCQFLLGDSDSNKRFHLVSWDEVKRPEEAGSLGLRSTLMLNKPLMGNSFGDSGMITEAFGKPSSNASGSETVPITLPIWRTAPMVAVSGKALCNSVAQFWTALLGS